ncbi:MAG TPA: ATP-binding protein [Ramlibacter sp.]|nr:ATP-binding protein [Ramlibacter sp.]
MKRAISIRARLVVGSVAVLLAFLALAGYAVQRAHEDSVRSAQFARLQATVYLLLAGAELDADGKLVMPPSFPEPRLSLPASGLYASVSNPAHKENWRSPSSVGLDLPFVASDGIGHWRFEAVSRGATTFLAVAYEVRWSAGSSQVPLALSVLEDAAPLEREGAAFVRTLWSWLGGTAVVLLVSQALLLQWALAPLARVTREVRELESGRQDDIRGRYPAEIALLTDNINELVRGERIRQSRYKEALSYLAHSLKTPLAVLRSSADDTAQLPGVVKEQVSRMDGIVQHQLARATAGGGAVFAPALQLAHLIERIRASLAKVYADKGVAFEVRCDPELSWRVEEGEAFELLGNLMDNAAKWSHGQVIVRAWRVGDRLCLCVEDDGPGFADTSDVLKLHVRGDERVPGHGVGLAVVDEIVRAHGGELRLGRSQLGGASVDITLSTA